jgi:hypothetical protein
MRGIGECRKPCTMGSYCRAHGRRRIKTPSRFSPCGFRTWCLDEDRKPLAGFSRADVVPFIGNAVTAEIRWRDGRTLASLAGRPVRFRFHMDRGDLYAFWVTSSADGNSMGTAAQAVQADTHHFGGGYYRWAGEIADTRPAAISAGFSSER